jgi:hypothetical protein
MIRIGMEFPQILKLFAVFITLKTGIYPIVRPRRIENNTGLAAINARGLTEIRASIGGMLTGLGIAALVYPVPVVYKVLGIVFTAIAVTRGISIIIDRSYERSNFYSLTTEIVLAILFFI